MNHDNLSIKLLSDITVFNKYAKFVPELGRRETWEELCDRNMQMHIKKYPELKEEIETVYREFILTKKVLPSMRSLQFSGKPIELAPNRLYNCCFVAVNDYRVFSEIMFLLLGGSGVGYSVQKHHVAQLPPVKKPVKTRRFVVGDSIEGWADAVKALVSAYLIGKPMPRFDFSDIRPKGAALITSGGKAPGPEPLKDCLHNIQKIFDRKKDGEQLSTLEVHDVNCFIADAVLAGGIRRAAMIALFNIDDEEMLTCKFGNWYELNPQRARANNSAMVIRHKVKKEDFFTLWDKVKASGSGEPGILFSNNTEIGTNPSLRKGTKVLTSEGIFPIEELENKEFFVKNLNGELSPAKCWLSGRNKTLFKITLKGKHSYYATAEHKWPVFKNGEYAKIATENLSVGDKLPILKQESLFYGKLGTYEDGFYIGWQLGDGWLTVRGDNGKLQHGLIVSDKDCEYGIDKILLNYLSKLDCHATFHPSSNDSASKEINTVNANLNLNIEKFGAGHKSNGLPKAVWKNGSEEFRKGLIDGLFSSDGNVEKGCKRINFSTKHTKLATDVCDLLGFYGIKTKVSIQNTKLNDKIYPQFLIRINDTESLKHFNKIFKLTAGYKQDILDNYLYRKANFKSNNKIEIISIEKTDLKEDVWDISVNDTTHCFQIAHCITGNCGEISLRSAQFCNLTEINMSNIESQKDLNARTKAATFISTLQAGYTDFHYLRDVWKKTTEKEALLGVSGTGIASKAYEKCNLTEAVELIIKENKRVSKMIGINPAARLTAIKPSGCLTPETKIKTNVGSISLKEIFEINDYAISDLQDKSNLWLELKEKILVKDENDDWQSVNKLYVNGKSVVYEIEFEDGTLIKATPEHRFKTTNRGWVRADEILESDNVISFI